ncbi:MAG TPA: hypothetical protein PK250_12850 [Syntrophobacter fumaroxidans]|nr:hypothetical protein [Syntrophobacter fumaroxidans]
MAGVRLLWHGVSQAAVLPSAFREALISRMNHENSLKLKGTMNESKIDKDIFVYTALFTGIEFHVFKLEAGAVRTGNDQGF